MDRIGFLILAEEMLNRSDQKGVKAVFWDDTDIYKVEITRVGYIRSSDETRVCDSKSVHR